MCVVSILVFVFVYVLEKKNYNQRTYVSIYTDLMLIML